MSMLMTRALGFVGVSPEAFRAQVRSMLAEQASVELEGVVRHVGSDWFTLWMEDGRERAIRMTERTLYRLDGACAEGSRVVRPGAAVFVGLRSGIASTVEAWHD